MIAELNELKWLLLPLYPFLVVVLFGAWLYIRFGRSKKLELRAALWGISLELKVDDTTGDV